MRFGALSSGLWAHEISLSLSLFLFLGKKKAGRASSFAFGQRPTPAFGYFPPLTLLNTPLAAYLTSSRQRLALDLWERKSSLLD